MNFICFNGIFNDETQPLFLSTNRGFRYGDGLFETMKIIKGAVVLEQFHFDRLYLGLKFLSIERGNFHRDEISRLIKELCIKNNCDENGRVRLAVFRDELHHASFVIEAMALNKEQQSLNKEGWVIDIYPHARKSCDAFSNLKSANYLPYLMADLYARQKGLHECLLLNNYNNICDASKANIFLLIDGDIITPALHQGCVSGVKRRFIIDQCKQKGLTVHQREVTERELLTASEVFLTNAIYDMRWVKSYRDVDYGCRFVSKFYSEVFATFL